MKNLIKLKATMKAWETFRDVARGTRSLAAAQVVRWQEHLDAAQAHFERCARFERVLMARADRPPLSGAAVLVAVGTDLGFCGALNGLIAREYARARPHRAPLRIVVGHRLQALIEDEAVVPFSAPASLGAVETLAGHIEDLLGRLDPPWGPRVEVVASVAVQSQGALTVRAMVPPWETVDKVASGAPGVPGPIAAGAPPVALSPQVAGQLKARHLVRHAWLAQVLCRAALCEADARCRTMTRAQDGAQRAIDGQTQTLRKLQQELVTQEMLEARGHGRG